MVIFSWEPRLELGIELLDRQHRELSNADQRLFISYKCRDDIQKVSKCLDFLNLTPSTISRRRRRSRCGTIILLYRDHQAKHNYLGTQLKFHSTALEASRFAPEKMDDFHKYLQAWIMEHLLEDDLKFAEFVKEADMQHASKGGIKKEPDKTGSFFYSGICIEQVV